MPETTPLIKAALNLRVGAGFDVYNNTYTDDGCFKTQNVSNKIIIEEEEEYKVVGWVTTNATTYPIASITTNTHRVLFFCIDNKSNTH